MKNILMKILLLLVSFFFSCSGVIRGQKIQVSDNGHFLTLTDNSPFFWLGDTGWELFIKLNKKDTEFYFKNRAAKGFNVIQCTLTGTNISGDLDTPNREGETAFTDKDPLRPNEKYFEHVDWVVKKAEEKGIHLTILPVWGYLIVDKNPFFDKEKAYKYGLFLGERYKNRNNIIWVLGGDREPDGYEDVWESLAKGLTDGGSDYLMTYHISGEHSTSDFFQNTQWLDINMIQSGHMTAYFDNYRLIEDGFNRIPVKPILDGEIIYEGIPISFCHANGRANDHHVRVEAYWSVFAGACGVTYDSNNIWMFYDNDERWSFWADRSWKETVDDPGSFQMHFLKNLVLSRPYLTRIPDQLLLNPKPSNGTDHLQVTRDGTSGRKDATYLMVYFPYLTHKYKILTNVIPAKKLRIWWYDPRTGEVFLKEEIENIGVYELSWGSDIQTNNTGPDWVLVIDDASKKYPAPGKEINIKNNNY